MRFFLLPFIGIFLCACGGGSGIAIPPIKTAAPSQGVFSVADETDGSFELFFGQILESNQGATISSETKSGAATLVSVSDTEVVLVTTNGEEYTFKLVSQTTTNCCENFNYERVGAGSTPDTILIRRFSDGSRDGVYKITELNQVSEIRADFVFGFRTEEAGMPTTASTANYIGNNTGVFYLGTGQRLFGGDADLTVDYTARTVDGILFDNTGNAQEGLEAVATLSGGSFTPDGTLNANNGITLTLNDSVNPHNSVPATSNTTINGAFFGSDAVRVAGGFSGTVQSNQQNIGSNTMGFSGKFFAKK